MRGVRPQQRHAGSRWRKRALVGGIGLAGAMAVAAVPVPAQAAPPTTSFTTPGGHTYTVPANVTEVEVRVVGAAGGSGAASQPGGRGAVVTATLPVTPGTTLYITVGAEGASNGNAGAGGGASDIRVGDDTPGSRVVVAGGGGGAGYAGGSGSSGGNGGGRGAPSGGGADGISHRARRHPGDRKTSYQHIGGRSSLVRSACRGALATGCRAQPAPPHQ